MKISERRSFAWNNRVNFDRKQVIDPCRTRAGGRVAHLPWLGTSQIKERRCLLRVCIYALFYSHTIFLKLRRYAVYLVYILLKNSQSTASNNKHHQQSCYPSDRVKLWGDVFESSYDIIILFIHTWYYVYFYHIIYTWYYVYIIFI